MFAPSTVQEMVDLISQAFDLADKYRMPAMVLADGMLGQMMEPVESARGRLRPCVPEKAWAAKWPPDGKRRPQHRQLPVPDRPEELEQLVKDRFARYEQVKAKRANGRARTSPRTPSYVAGGLRRHCPHRPGRREQGRGEKGHEGGPGPAHHPVALPHRGDCAAAARHGKSFLVRGDEHGPDGGRRRAWPSTGSVPGAASTGAPAA